MTDSIFNVYIYVLLRMCQGSFLLELTYEGSKGIFFIHCLYYAIAIS